MNTIQRRIKSTNQPATLHRDAVREGRAAVMQGLWERHAPFLSMMNTREQLAEAFIALPKRQFR